MSCKQTTQAYEACHEAFWDLMEDYEFKENIYMNFLDSQDQWKEKEFGFHEDPYDNFFDYLWKRDPEAVSLNVRKAAVDYLEDLGMERWMATGGTCD